MNQQISAVKSLTLIKFIGWITHPEHWFLINFFSGETQKSRARRPRCDRLFTIFQLIMMSDESCHLNIWYFSSKALWLMTLSVVIKHRWRSVAQFMQLWTFVEKSPALKFCRCSSSPMFAESDCMRYMLRNLSLSELWGLRHEFEWISTEIFRILRYLRSLKFYSCEERDKIYDDTYDRIESSIKYSKVVDDFRCFGFQIDFLMNENQDKFFVFNNKVVKLKTASFRSWNIFSREKENFPREDCARTRFATPAWKTV